MEEHVLSPLAVSHLLQHTLRSLSVHENSQWVYAVFWRILPRNYPPPNRWDAQGGYDRSRRNRRNWILVWEDGFCNFAATSSSASYIANCQGLQPELFFKMSHEIYSYGEGLIGKVAADHSHKWIYSEPNDQEISLLSSSSWHNNNSADIQPRTWEAQFQSGIKTIALIAVREGVVQLGAIHKVVEDLSCVVFLRKKFHYIERIPGVLLPHPSSSSSVCPIKLVDGCGESDIWQFSGRGRANPGYELYDGHSYLNHQLIRVTPSMSSLEALLSKLPSVVPLPLPLPLSSQSPLPLQQRQLQSISMEKVAKEEIDQELYVDETSTSISPPYCYHCQNQEF
ncbi:protein RICE SALT SENSITIVE 3-like isoform X1 [Cucurbita maxima]|uniref:Protein RICE SALT SENSITIVE 3-like isoform X1 n=1 Tax=Cucurbita maxima TaxID=3661 RepID=A0A6J1K903_CUCMA|nr:protein RICE SALT SENSITIVE 3-like isoform X1 [Cucurbita maxima]